MLIALKIHLKSDLKFKIYLISMVLLKFTVDIINHSSTLIKEKTISLKRVAVLPSSYVLIRFQVNE